MAREKTPRPPRGGSWTMTKDGELVPTGPTTAPATAPASTPPPSGTESGSDSDSEDTPEEDDR